jgi:prephenate dehydratase
MSTSSARTAIPLSVSPQRMSSTCAYLGPNGSYTSQAALHLLPSASLRPCTTIASVFAAETTHAVVPLENTIHGVVQETLACLLGTERDGWSVVRTYDKGIQHALVVARGTRMEDIRWVASHEQVCFPPSPSIIQLFDHLSDPIRH